MSAQNQAHWQGVYESKAADTVSWFQQLPDASLRMITVGGSTPPAKIVDVGGGASTLVDELVQRGFDVTVLDIASSALTVARDRMGDKAASVDWQVADITQWRSAKQYDLWHDRAVFHFLTDANDREKYVQSLKAGLKPGGLLILATFAEEGPEHCSGLPVQRYNAAGLVAALGAGFQLIEDSREEHLTPWGSSQAFTWTLFRRLEA